MTRVVPILLLALLCGCASAPAATVALPAGDAKTMAELYVLNDSGWTLMPGNQAVTDNGNALASLPRQTYVRVLIAPGPHVLHPDPPLWKQEVTLDAQAAHTYYVAIAYKPERSWALPFAGSPLLLKQLTAEQAAPLLKEMSAQ